MKKELTKEIVCAYLPHDVGCVVDIKAYSKFPDQIIPANGFDFSKVLGRVSYITDGKSQWIYVRYNSWDDLGGIVGTFRLSYEFEDQSLRRHAGIHASDEVRLVLRPLSDLTKPITHNGETFVPIEKMQMDLIVDRTDLLNINGMFDMGIGYQVEWQIIQKLHSWHFDTFGLIEAGLAIDINTINK